MATERSSHFFGEGLFTNSLTHKWLTDVSLTPKSFHTYSCLSGIYPDAPLISVGSSLPATFRNELEEAHKRFKVRTSVFYFILGHFIWKVFDLDFQQWIAIGPGFRISQHTPVFNMKVFTLQNSIFHWILLKNWMAEEPSTSWFGFMKIPYWSRIKWIYLDTPENSMPSFSPSFAQCKEYHISYVMIFAAKVFVWRSRI